MDPYIERAAIFPDFHDSLITFIRGALQPLLKPKYVALTAERLYVVESERPIKPDVAVVRTPKEQPGELWREEMREPLIHIIEPAAEGRVVTAIEVLSPDNKRVGAGRTSYMQKREEFWASGINLVEIDLLRDGEPTVRVSSDKLAALRPWHYLTAVTRRWPSRQEVYAFPLQRRLPRVGIPLAENDKDVTLNLQAVFTRCWDEGPYPELLRYAEAPLGRMSADEARWCEEQLRAAGMRLVGA